ncbi:DUF1266 domain-containing protein [Ereboglobus luteus]|nr:DUF1266 domain-containing protein [Ereboglobus luteus]
MPLLQIAITIPDSVTPYIAAFIITVTASYFFFVKILPALQGRPSPIREADDEEDDDEHDDGEEDDDEDCMIYYNDDPDVALPPEQYKKLSLGAIYSEQQKAWLNTLDTGLPKKEVRRVVGEWWGIAGVDDAASTLDYLRDKGFRHYFPVVMRAYREPAAEQKRIVAAAFPDCEEDREKTLAQISHLNETLDELVEDGVIDSTASASIERYGVAGWDCGRLVYLARLCREMRYINDEQTWNYIEAAHQIAGQTFGSWKEYAKSYVIGRALWGGADCDNSDIAEIADYLLEDEDSPWVQMPW